MTGFLGSGACSGIGDGMLGRSMGWGISAGEGGTGVGSVGGGFG
jgi:hypothetical protein